MIGLACLCAFKYEISGQTAYLDSLRYAAESAESDSAKADQFGALAFESMFTNTDSAVAAGRRAVSFARKTRLPKVLAQAHSDHAAALVTRGDSRLAAGEYHLALAGFSTASDSLGIAKSHNNLGQLYTQENKYDSAIFYLLQAHRFFEAIGHEAFVDRVNLNLASLYQEVGALGKAKESVKASIKYRQASGDRAGLAAAYGNFGNILCEDKKFAEAIIEYNLGIAALGSEVGQQALLSTLFTNLGISEDEISRDVNALAHLKQGLRYALEANSPIDIGFCARAFANFQFKHKAFKSAKENYQLAEFNLKSTAQYEQLVPVYRKLSLVSASLGDHEEALRFAGRSSDLSDSLALVSTTDAMLDASQKYETVQKEAALAESRAARLEDQLTARRQTSWLLGGLGIAVLAGAVGYLLYRQQRLRNLQLAQQAELELALARIEAQNELQEQRLRISRDLHDNIGAQLSFLISSVDGVRLAEPLDPRVASDKLGQISGFAQDTVRDLRDTVWAMNRDAVSVEDLEARLASFLQQAAGHTAARTRFELEVSPAARALSPMSALVGVNVYRVGQEAIHNAFKYARAACVQVNIDATPGGGLTLSVADDGVGFGESEKKAALLRGGGNGLLIMRKRAGEIGGEVTLETSATGTRVELGVPPTKQTTPGQAATSTALAV